jgi:hypothetical protein
MTSLARRVRRVIRAFRLSESAAQLPPSCSSKMIFLNRLGLIAMIVGVLEAAATPESRRTDTHTLRDRP